MLPTLPDAAARLRDFNRFYTRQIGVLNEGLLQSPYSLTECRVIYELAARPGLTAADLVRDLGLDAGYLSRLLKKLRDLDLVTAEAAPQDGRQMLLHLTAAGQAAYARLDEDSAREMAALLAPLTVTARTDLLAALATLRASFERPDPSNILLRPHQPGDMGWIIHRQALLYHREYGWNAEFEALIASVSADFITRFDPTGEAGWIAEHQGRIVGSVFLVRKDAETGKLRLLYVEDSMRGCGLGRRLVEACIAQARAFGYKRLILWTNANLLAARKLYQSLGFTLTAAEPHHSFGHDLIGEEWGLDL